MNIGQQIMELIGDEVDSVKVVKDGNLYGLPATKVVVNLENGKQVIGVFATRDRPSFGGVETSDRAEIAELMTAKINSVLRGTAE